MEYINHRINTLAQLQHVPKTNGIEIDIRYHNNDLVLHHDPFGHHDTNPLKLEDLLKAWDHAGPIILNVKTEGVEQCCIDLMNQYQIKQWFFLDLSMPYFVKYANAAAQGAIEGFSKANLAVRFSEFEALEYALEFKDKVDWMWVDCFTKYPLTAQNYQKIMDANFKICLVSPELQKHDIAAFDTFKSQLKDMTIHTVCTKRPDLWGQLTDDATLAFYEKELPILCK